ncbi:hypothetical protein [Blastopirellula marina]|uniref:Uncharacterized protein n=1 Tax=Blastopirellula marina TaxID=124 RepID=A0A2S8FTI1_9BACT|nr:hypothetical protein [Blastopirellula marina]PQO35491.1 hypothetical protein C5Y98_14120 [Blastopirellula marina]PQO41335.1 hypothetical protein C5Y93_29915 [Blastopirellula marina]PTL44131.1 hypothetical protein C5Y97_14130 [Blastopirellula marina]
MHEFAEIDPLGRGAESQWSNRPAWRFYASLGLMGLVWGTSYYVANQYRPGEVAAVLAYGGAYFVISHLAILLAWPAPHVAIRLAICGTLASLTAWRLLTFDPWPPADELIVWISLLICQAALLAGMAHVALRDRRTPAKRGFRFSLWSLVVVVTATACGLGTLRILKSWFGTSGDWFDLDLLIVLLPVLALQIVGALGPLALLTPNSLSRRLLMWLAGIALIAPAVWLVFRLMLLVESQIGNWIFFPMLSLAGQQAAYLTIALLPIVRFKSPDAPLAEVE